MKKLTFTICVFFFALIITVSVHAQKQDGYTLFASIRIDSLELNSFSCEWDEKKLYTLYDELMLNTHGPELFYLSEINLYPDSPDNVSGYYVEDVSFINGETVFGDNAYIELFHADKKTTPAAMAGALAHEYGHHYTIFNMMNYEKCYYSEWDCSEYAKLRFDESSYAVYDTSAEEYDYIWDITEILADDYVQLLGSPSARKSFDYIDADDAIKNGLGYVPQPNYFNRSPQRNTYMPLASDCEGIYELLLKMAGFDDNTDGPELIKRPEILEISEQDSAFGRKFCVQWDMGISLTSDLRYTLVMFPQNFPGLVTAVKTVDAPSYDGFNAVIGTVANVNSDGTLSLLADTYYGVYVFRVYAQDERGFIYSSEDFLYDFGYDTSANDILDYLLGYNNILSEDDDIKAEATTEHEMEKNTPLVSADANFIYNLQKIVFDNEQETEQWSLELIRIDMINLQDNSQILITKTKRGGYKVYTLQPRIEDGNYNDIWRRKRHY